MTPYEKELSRWLDNQADSSGDWDGIQRRIQAGDPKDAPYMLPPPEPPRRRHGRTVAFAAAAAALTVAAAGALAFAVRNTAPPPLDQPGTAVTPEASGKTQPESAASPGAAVSAPGKTVTGIPGATGVASATEPTQTIDLPGSLQISQVFPADWDYEMDVWIELGRYDEETNTIYATMRNDTDFACTYGMGFSLLRRENGQWVSCEPEKGWAIPDIAAILESHGKASRSFCLDPFFPDGIEPGDYMLEAVVWSRDESQPEITAYLQFQVENAD